MLVLLLAFLSAIPLPSKPAKYVTDNAGVLDAARAGALDESLAKFERETSNQLLVYVDRDLPPETTIEEMGSQAIHEWGVGQKGKDNGAILFLFTNARKMRIEVGYGLEAQLTDAKAKRITSTVIKPLLQKGDTTGAVEAGADAMMQTIRGLDFKGTGTTVAERGRAASSGGVAIAVILPLVILTFVFGFIGLIIWAVRSGRMKTGLTPGASWATTPARDDSMWSSSSSSSSTSSSSWDSSSSSSDSSSDFSGGGGDGGGGGSSDSW